MIGDERVDRQQPPLEADRQLVAQPIIQAFAPATSGHALDSIAQLGQSYDADEYTVLIAVGQPSDDTRIGTLLHPLRNNHGVQKEVHRSSLRVRSMRRVAFSPDLR